MSEEKKECLVCKRGTDETPLVNLEYKDNDYWICPQHIPVLIHDPQKLDGILPDAKNMQAG